MRNINILISFIAGILIISACGNDYYHDTGLANGNHDCTIWEYLQNDPEHWDSVRIMIEQAGIKDLFDGTNPQYQQITFFGPTNYSVIAFLLKYKDEEGKQVYHSLKEVPKDICRQMVLSHVIPERLTKDEFDYEVKGTDTGGTIIQTLTGIDLRVYRIKTPYNGIPDIGPERMAIHALQKGYKVDISSADIKMTNGVVHSLSNTYEMAEL